MCVWGQKYHNSGGGEGSESERRNRERQTFIRLHNYNNLFHSLHMKTQERKLKGSL